MDEPQEQPKTCGDCWFSENFIPPTPMADILDFADVKCSADKYYHSATDTCSDWKPKQ